MYIGMVTISANQITNLAMLRFFFVLLNISL